MILDNTDLNLEQIIAVARHGEHVELSDQIRNNLAKTRKLIEK